MKNKILFDPNIVKGAEILNKELGRKLSTDTSKKTLVYLLLINERKPSKSIFEKTIKELSASAYRALQDLPQKIILDGEFSHITNKDIDTLLAINLKNRYNPQSLTRYVATLTIGSGFIMVLLSLSLAYGFNSIDTNSNPNGENKEKEYDIVPEEEEENDTLAYEIPSICVGRSKLDKEQIIKDENKIVSSWFKNSDSLIIESKIPHSGRKTILRFHKKEIKKVVQKFKGEGIITISNDTSLLTGGYREGAKLLGGDREGFIKKIDISNGVVSKIVKHYDLATGSEYERVKKILTFVQEKPHSMKYRYDSPLSMGEMGAGSDADGICYEYVRFPGVSLIQGLKNGAQGDCDDFAFNFVLLCLAAGIPEEKLSYIIGPGHAYVGVSYDIEGLEERKGVYYHDGEKIVIPIEPTTSARMNIQYDKGGATDTLYRYRNTIGGPMNIPGEKVVIRNKDNQKGTYSTKIKKFSPGF